MVNADDKGVLMRRPPQEDPKAPPRRAKEGKANKKQMACIGAYTIEAFVRTSDDIRGELLRDRRVFDRHWPAHKHF